MAVNPVVAGNISDAKFAGQWAQENYEDGYRNVAILQLEYAIEKLREAIKVIDSEVS